MLYYPYINAPTPVLYQALLYWDELATVVPPDYEGLLDEPMRWVSDAGLYRPIEAQRVYKPASLDNLGPELEHALRDLPLDDLLPPDPATADPSSTEMYTHKLHRGVVADLAQRGLARINPGPRETLTASPYLLMILLSITARRVADQANGTRGWTSPRSLRPYTDIDVAFQAAHDPLAPRDTIPSWQVEIGRLLPVPTDEVMARDVLAFRRRYDDERRRLVRAIDDLLAELSQRYDHPEDIARQVEQELADAVSDLNAAARASRLTWLTRSVAVCVGLVGTAEAVPHLPPQLAIPLVLAGGVATNLVTSRIRHDQRLRHGRPADFTYLQRIDSAMRGLPDAGG